MRATRADFLSIFVLLLLAASGPAAAGNWPAFRGTNASGNGDGDNPPVEWNAEEGENVRFKVPIPGRAHSSPIIWGDRLYLTTAVNSGEDAPFRHGLYGDVDIFDDLPDHEWRLLALDKRTGEILWQQRAYSGKPRVAHHIKATQNNATPVTDGRYLVAMLGSEGLYCYDMNGKLLWKKDFGRLDTGWFFDSSYEWGHASSPVIVDDRVVVQVDRSGGSFLAAYGLADGKELWRTERDNLPSWGTPTLLEVGEHRELVTNGTKMIRGYDPATGKELWRLGPNSEVTVGTPVVGHGMAFVTGGYPPVRPIYAVRPGGRGDISLSGDATSSEHIAWSTSTGGTYMPSPIVYGDHLFTLGNNGVLTSYHAKTGEQLNRQRVARRGGAFTASLVAADGKLYAASEDGDVYVLEAGPEPKVVATNPMGEVLMATPAISDGTLYVRGISHLFALSAEKGSATAGEGKAGDE